MVDQENLQDFKVKTINDLEAMAKKLKRQIVKLEKSGIDSPSDFVHIAHALTMLTLEYRLIKREIMDTIIR